MAGQSKTRYWCGVCYPENMIDNWQSDIYDSVQVPFAYCVHDLDRDSQSEHRKDHVHILLAFPNTTTYKHALEVFNSLSKAGCICCNTCQPAYNVRSMYEYLIHNTEGCKAKGKFRYPVTSRICGNNFDIGNFEQLSIDEKNKICDEIAQYIIDFRVTNFVVLYQHICGAYDDIEYRNCLKGNTSFFKELCRGNYLLLQSLKQNES